MPTQQTDAIMNENKPNQSLAITSLVLGVLSVTFCWLLAAVPAVITGHVALGRVRRLPDQYGGKGFALAGLIMGYIGIAVTLAIGGLALVLMPSLSHQRQAAQRIRCINHLKQIGLAFRLFAVDHNDLFPFNISTNQGGTFELCARDADGFEQDPTPILMVLTNELASPVILCCPADDSKRPALNFGTLTAANISYLFRSGTNIDETRPGEVLARCPIHGHVVLCDGSVEQGPAR